MPPAVTVTAGGYFYFSDRSHIIFAFFLYKAVKTLYNVSVYLFLVIRIKVKGAFMGQSNGIKIKKPAYTKDTEIYRIENIPEVFIPVNENYTATVGSGDRVLVGQLLGIALGKQIPLHCSVSGTVKGTVNIGGTEYIEIENDGKYELCSDIAPCEKRLSQMSTEEMLDRIRLCGIREWKYLLSMCSSAKRFAVNCLDNDPYSSDKKCAIANYASEIIGGSKIVLKILSLRLCELVIEKNSTDAINTLIDKIGESRFFDIIETTGSYPMGESMRIPGLLGGDDTDDDSVCILDVHTVAAIYRAFSLGIPYVRTTVSIGGSGAFEDGCYDIPIGTPIRYVARQCAESEQENTEPYTTIVGGMMCGSVCDPTATLVSYDTHSIVFQKNKEMTVRVGSCIGCGRCDKACPDKLLPSVFVSGYEANFDSAYKASGMEWCSECGACSYVCPANIPICDIANKDADPLIPDKKYKKETKTSAPFIHHAETTKSINADLIIALGALLVWAVCAFGTSALVLSATAILAAATSELIFNLLTKSRAFAVLDLSSVVCGMMCALTLTKNTPVYVAAIASFFAVIFMKGIFGGNGKNLLHSAFGARVFVSLFFHDAFVYEAKNYTLFDLLLGNTEGGFGEVSVIILVCVFIYLAIKKIVSPTVCLCTLSTFAAVTFLCAAPGNAPNEVTVSLTGTAIIFVSVFSSVEYSTVPKSIFGKVTYGAVCGAVAALIGKYTSSEGAYISALIASTLTPLFNRFYEVEAYDDQSAPPSPIQEEAEDIVDEEEDGEDEETIDKTTVFSSEDAINESEKEKLIDALSSKLDEDSTEDTKKSTNKKISSTSVFDKLYEEMNKENEE